MAHLPADHLSRSQRLLAAGLGALKNVQSILDGRERIPQLMREDGEKGRLTRIGLARLLDFPVRELLNPPLSFRGEVFNGIRHRKVEARIQTGESDDPVCDSGDVAGVLQAFGAEQDAEDGRPEQSNLMDELLELKAVFDPLVGVGDGGEAHLNRARG